MPEAALTAVRGSGEAYGKAINPSGLWSIRIQFGRIIYIKAAKTQQSMNAHEAEAELRAVPLPQAHLTLLGTVHLIMVVKYLMYVLLAVTYIFMFGVIYKFNELIAADHNYNLTSEMNLLISFGGVLLLYLLGHIHYHFIRKGAADPNAADDGSLSADAAASPGKKSKPSILLAVFMLICLIITIKYTFDLYAML